MFRGKIILFFVAYSLGLCASQGFPQEPKFALTFTSPLYACDDSQSNSRLNTTALEIQGNDETSSVISGPISLLEALPSKGLRIELVGKKEVSGKFEVVMTMDVCDLCEELHPDSPYWKYIKLFGLPSQCPFTPGDYMVDGFAPQKDDLPLNSANVASYQVELYAYSNVDGTCENYANQEFLFCVMYDFTIEAV